uniref:Galectin n=1 Tax=Salvator merianae TaxID=96440 RepID=A0A8D0CAA3_SALMN
MSGIVCTNLKVAPGQRISVKGDIPAGAKSFAVNLGKTKDEVGLHLNPRFDAHGDINTIVCNSKNKGQWGTEHRETNFPFQAGSNTEVSFSHDKKEFTITLPGNYQFKFPYTLGADTIEYLCVEGDFVFKGVSLS